jgi:hypothetical protein
MRNIPYTTKTGVKIGSRYNESPKPMPIEDQDMITIQSWFICKPDWHRARNMERLVLTVCTSVAGLIMFVMWLSK